MAKTTQQPIVLVWEDLHWADPSSLGLLETLLDLPQQCPLLLILIYRPRHTSRIWALHRKISQSLPECYLSVELSALSNEESEQLLKNMLGDCNIPQQIFQLIFTKAEGNPFYLEEVIRSLIDSGGIARSEDNQQWIATAGIKDIPIPNTLQGVIMARIDRLSPELKRTLQVSSVIGRNFSYDVLAQVFNQK
jgi:predicted ATPase